VNSAQRGGAYGYVDMGGWGGGQANFVMVPFADFNLLKFPDKAQAMAKIQDLTMLSDIFPTGFHGARTAGVDVGSTVYIAGAGPVGLAAAASAQLLGAAVVIIGDRNEKRLAHAKKAGFEIINITKHDNLTEAAPADVLNQLMDISFVAGGVGIPGLYVVEDPGAPNEEAKHGMLKIRFGKGWSKSLHFHTGQAPVLQYNRQLMQAILHDRVHIAKIVNATLIPLEEAPQGYHQFDDGAPKKFILDPNGLAKKAA
jgi:glutathione-independent formaldehyde dehydrogenase